MKESLREAPNGFHLSPSEDCSSQRLETSEEGGISVASSTEKSVNGTHSGLLVPEEESLGILFTFQSINSKSVSIRAWFSTNPGSPSARFEMLPGSGPVRESRPRLQFLLHLSKFVSLTYAIFETSILPFVFRGATTVSYTHLTLPTKA